MAPRHMTLPHVGQNQAPPLLYIEQSAPSSSYPNWPHRRCLRLVLDDDSVGLLQLHRHLLLAVCSTLQVAYHGAAEQGLVTGITLHWQIVGAIGFHVFLYCSSLGALLLWHHSMQTRATSLSLTQGCDKCVCLRCSSEACSEPCLRGQHRVDTQSFPYVTLSYGYSSWFL